jgi:hypothetical protein
MVHRQVAGEEDDTQQCKMTSPLTLYVNMYTPS